MPGPVAPAGRQDTAEILDRLVKVEGHLRGIHHMVEQERRCVDILNQITAVRAALGQIAVRLLVDHLRCYMAVAIQGKSSEEKQTEAELSELHQKLV